MLLTYNAAAGFSISQYILRIENHFRQPLWIRGIPGTTNPDAWSGEYTVPGMPS